MPKSTLQAEETAIVLFDFLNGHVRDGDTTHARYVPVIASAVRLLGCARRRGMMIAYANAAHRRDNATSAKTLRDTDNRLRPIPPGPAARFQPAIVGGTWEAQVIDELAPQPADYIIPKYRWSAFYQTCLDLALRSRQMSTIVLCGGSTDVGIASTAFAARDMDYHIIIASDACTSPEQDNHDQFMQRIFPRMTRVRTVAQIESMLTPLDLA